MKALLLGACAALLSACSTLPQQRALSDAYASGQLAKAEAVRACSVSADVSGCMLGVALAFGGGGQDQVPVVQSTLSTVLNSSLLGTIAGAGIGAVRDIKVAQSQERVQIANTNAQAATQTAMFSAFQGVAQSGYSAIAQTSTAGFNATTATAQAGFNASTAGVLSIQALGTAAVNAGSATAQAIAAMPPTYQAGGDIVGRDYVRDESATGRDRVQGDGNETARTVTCDATGGSGGSAQGNGGSSGTTGQSGSANPAAGAGAGAVNNCGS